MSIIANNFFIGKSHIKTSDILKTINDRAVPEQKVEPKGNTIPVIWKTVKHVKVHYPENPKKFHEKSQYLKDMLTLDEPLHKKKGYKADSKTMLHPKASYNIDRFEEGNI